ncbi:hypothetical protein ACOME3_010769 [Neoechinorhynchus agilis]
MNTVLNRVNAILSFTTTVMGVLAFAIFVTTALENGRDQARIEGIAAERVKLHRSRDYASFSEGDLADIVFNLEANMTGLYNWNVKQLFLWIMATYKTSDNPINEVFLWDSIMLKENAEPIGLKSEVQKYFFYDVGHGLKGNPEVNLSFNWHLIPHVGLMKMTRPIDLESDEVVKNATIKVEMPNEYDH